jgi:hypothetical protein
VHYKAIAVKAGEVPDRVNCGKAGGYETQRRVIELSGKDKAHRVAERESH